jgi:hypothetical protein
LRLADPVDLQNVTEYNDRGTLLESESLLERQMEIGPPELIPEVGTVPAPNQPRERNPR